MENPITISILRLIHERQLGVFRILKPARDINAEDYVRFPEFNPATLDITCGHCRTVGEIGRKCKICGRFL